VISDNALESYDFIAAYRGRTITDPYITRKQLFLIVFSRDETISPVKIVTHQDPNPIMA